VDSDNYKQKKARFDNLLTLFGRKPVLEAIRSGDITPVRLHLATSNRASPELTEMQEIADRRHCEIVFHTRQALARISKNGRQDQGVALDVSAPRYLPLDDLPDAAARCQLIAIDAVTNPQNLGMIVRSVAASPIHGIILPREGCAPIDGLVIKASAGTLFKCRVYHCRQLADGLNTASDRGYRIVGMAAEGKTSLADMPSDEAIVFVLGNETRGLSDDVASICSEMVSIPLANGVESLNVSVAAALVAFHATV